MSAPPVVRYLNTDSPLEEVIETLNQFQREAIQAMAARLTRADNFASTAREGIKFRTPAAGDATVRLTTGLSSPAKHVVCSWLQRDDYAAVGGPWSCVATNVSSTEMTVTFTGLAASTAFTASFLVE